MAAALGTQLITACKKGDVSSVLSLLGHSEAVKKAGHALRAALEHRRIDCARLVLPLATSMHLKSALEECALIGYCEGVEFLLAANVLTPDNHYPLSWAAQRGHADCVKALLPHYPPNTLALGSILMEAAYHGHLNCIQLLIPVADMALDNSRALGMAAKQGHVDCIRELLAVSNPLADESYAFLQALKYNHTECVDVLYPLSDAPAVLQRLQATYPDHPFLWKALEALVLEKEHFAAKVAI